MRRSSPNLRVTFVVLTLLVIALVTVQTRRSSASPATRVPASPVPQERGKMIAQLDFHPPVNGFGFRNYGRDHDNENDLNPGNLIALFGADNVCQSGSTARDCVLT